MVRRRARNGQRPLWVRALALGLVGATATCAAIPPLAAMPPLDGRSRARASGGPRKQAPPDAAPRDPDDAPYMRAPNSQLQRFSARSVPWDHRRGSTRRRVAFTLLPAFASLWAPLAARGSERRPGGGVEIQADVALVRWLWFRAGGSLTGHAVPERFGGDDQTTRIAKSGAYAIGTVFAGLVYAVDLGRVLPTIEFGPGMVIVSGPEGIARGQRDARCRTDLTCEVGLRCDVVADVCRPSPVVAIAGGIAIDGLIGDRWTLGAGARYWADLSDFAAFPFYLTLTLRAGVRF